jgi:high affinity choline transporter 7
MVAYWVGIVMRLLAGESLFNLRPIIKYPLFDEENDVQKFPFRTISMLISFALNIIVSLLTKFIFEREYLSKKWDLFQCVTNIPIEAVALKDSVTLDELSKLNTSNLNNAKYSFNQINEIPDPTTKSSNM